MYTYNQIFIYLFGHSINVTKVKYTLCQSRWWPVQYMYKIIKRNSPHVALLVSSELAIRIALHTLQELALQRSRLGWSWWVCGRLWIPVAGHLLAIGSSEGEPSLTKGLTGDRWGIVGVAALFAPRALNGHLSYFRVVNGHNGMCGCLFCRKSIKGVVVSRNILFN